MDTEEIKKLINCIEGKCLSLDEIPLTKVNVPYLMCYNCESSSSAGLHWLGLAVILDDNKKRVVLACDPLGLPPVLKRVIDFVNKNSDGKLICNKYPLQSSSSNLCGNYIVLFLHHIHGGADYPSFLEKFSDTPTENDKKVINIFKRVGELPKDILRRQVCTWLQKH